MEERRADTIEKQEAVLEAWLNNPLLPLKEIAEIAGIGERTFCRYRTDEKFMAEYRKRQKQRFAALEGKAVQLLEDELNNRNWNAIKYTLDGLGYKPTDRVEITETTIKVDVVDD